MSEQRPILLITGGPVTAPLWPLLAERYDLAFLYAAAAQQAQNIGLPAAALGSVLDGDLQEAIENQAALLSARVVVNLPAISARFAAAYGPGAPKLLNGALPEWFAGYAHHLLLSEISVLAQLERLAGTGRHIAGCVTHEDVAPDTRALVNWCNARGIPTIHVPHAPCHLLPGVPDIHRETRAAWIAASGPAVARFYQDAGVPEGKIRVTGGPQWDELYGAMPDRVEARAVLAIEHDGPVLCYMSTWGQTTSMRSGFEAEFEDGWRAVLATARELGAYVMVLLHWNDQRQGAEEHYGQALEAAGVPGLVTRQHKTYLLKAADVLVAQGPSNMCIEAAILGTPSAYLQTEGFDYATPLPYRGTPETIGGAIRQALASPRSDPWTAFVQEYNAQHPEGGAAEQIAEMVFTLCP